MTATLGRIAGPAAAVATLVTDPTRATLLVHVSFRSLDGNRLHLYAVYDPALANSVMGDSGWTSGQRAARSGRHRRQRPRLVAAVPAAPTASSARATGSPI